jgi:hypothetical protein
VTGDSLFLRREDTTQLTHPLRANKTRRTAGFVFTNHGFTRCRENSATAPTGSGAAACATPWLSDALAGDVELPADLFH